MKKLIRKWHLPFALTLFFTAQFLNAQTPVNDLIGVNARAKDQVNEKLKQFSLVREYHGWETDESQSTTGDVECTVGPLKWNPTADPTDYTNFDEFYPFFEGRAYPVLKGVSYQMRGATGYDEATIEMKPYCQGFIPANLSEGYRVPPDGGPSELTTLPVNYESQNFISSPVGGISFWLDPMFGVLNEVTRVNVRTSGFTDINKIKLSFTYSGSAFELASNFSTYPGLTMPTSNNFSVTLDWTGSNTISIPDGEILFSFDLKLIQNAQFVNIEGSPFEDPEIERNSVPIDLNLITIQNRFLRTHTIEEVNYFIEPKGSPFADCSKDYCFSLWSSGFQALTQSGVNIVWDPNAFSYVGFTPVSGLPNADDITWDFLNTSDGIINFGIDDQTNGNVDGIDWNELTEIAEICLDPTCNGDQGIGLNGHGATLQQFDPDSWREHALWLSAFALHFGEQSGVNLDFENQVYNTLVSSTEQNAIGLNNGIVYLENNNEPDKSWYDNLSEGEYNAGLSAWHFSPEQFALMCSVDYDGHSGVVKSSPTSNIDIGVKNVNPNVSMVMAGLAGLKKNYIQQMVDWFETNRTGANKIIPFEVINVHHYPTQFSSTLGDLSNSELQIESGGFGVPPEEEGTLTKLNDFLASVGAMHPEMKDMEFWITEFGYDSHPSSPNAALPDMDIGSAGNARTINYDALSPGDKSILEQAVSKAQADWLVRYYFAISAAKGVSGPDEFVFNRATSFCIKDGFTDFTPGLFTTPGLLYADDSPKKSWFWVMTLKNVLESYKFDIAPTIVSCGNTLDSEVFKYVSDDMPDIYAVWDGDSDGKDDECLHTRFCN